MANTTIVGLVFDTILTIFVMPALYAITTDLRGLFLSRFFLRDPEERFRPVSDDELLGNTVPADD